MSEKTASRIVAAVVFAVVSGMIYGGYRFHHNNVCREAKFNSYLILLNIVDAEYKKCNELTGRDKIDCQDKASDDAEVGMARVKKYLENSGCSDD